MRFDITALYCCLDDFTKIYEDWECHHLIGKTCQRRRKGKLSLSELLLIMILFHTGNSRNFKTLRGGPVFSTSFCRVALWCWVYVMRQVSVWCRF